MRTNTKNFRTTYATAVNWLGKDCVMCNNIVDVDPSVWDNMRFPIYYWEDEDGNTYDDECDVPEGKHAEEKSTEIYQWFLTSFSEGDVEWLEEHFGLLFTYSEALGLYVLCVDHWGTSWDCVAIDTDLKNASCKEGERIK